MMGVHHEKALRDLFITIDIKDFRLNGCVCGGLGETCYFHAHTVPEARAALDQLHNENLELRGRLRMACESCAECGHIDYRELDDILDAPLQAGAALRNPAPPERAETPDGAVAPPWARVAAHEPVRHAVDEGNALGSHGEDSTSSTTPESDRTEAP